MLSPAEEIKSRLDVVEVIQGYLKLNKAGAYWKGLCPFHNEKTPSFMVTPARQIWHCFGCGEGGDIFSFVGKMEGLEFGDVLRLLAEKAGVKLKKQDPQLVSQRKNLYEICELAAKFFERQLLSKTGQMAAAYLKERGVAVESIKNFRLGWAPDSWQSLHNFLNAEGYDDGEIDRAGLIVKGETIKEYHDRFRHRVMFPIADSQGQVVGFTGRVFDKVKGKTVHADAGKYVNTPNTVLYDKSQVLYGLDKARSVIRSEGCILVEGTLDVVMSHQAGVSHVVATCGTAFGSGHARIIKRYTDRLMLAFDADEAGDSALKKGIALALAAGFSVSAILIPKGHKDTADVVKHDPGLWQKQAADNVPYLAHLITRSLENYSNALEGKKKILAGVLPFIKNISSPLEKDYWLEELSRKIAVSKDVLGLELKRLPAEYSAYEPSKNAPPLAPERNFKNLPSLRQEEYLLSLLIRYPDLKRRVGTEELELFSQPKLLTLAQGLLANTGAEIPDTADSSIILMSEMLADFNIDPEAEFAQTLTSLKKQYLQSKLKAIQADIKTAEAASDAAALDLLLKEFNNLTQKLTQL
ncbi:MAG: DNA primase [Parcubacteria group bacterium]|nr:DNA primase [Parcubacteria group bacterium]